MTARHHTAAKLRQTCRSLRTSILEQALATDAEVAAFWPGGAENPDRGYDGWIECYAQYMGLVRRLELRERTTDQLRDGLAAALRRATSRAPLIVQLSIGSRAVYQKSAWALWFLDSLDATTRTVALVAEEMLNDPTLSELQGMPAITQGLAWRTWAWILTHDEVGLPFGDVDTIEPPDWTKALLNEDYLALYVAHRALHFEDTSIMANAFPREEKERSRLDLSGFLASYAADGGLSASDVIRRFGLPEVFGTAVATAEAHRVATANAKSARGS